MRVLLDECLPRKLKRELTGHAVSTVPEMEWAGIKNGKLMALMESVFEVFITVDGNLTYQQNLQGRQIALVVLSAPDNTFETLALLMPQVLAVLTTIAPSQVVSLAALEAAG